MAFSSNQTIIVTGANGFVAKHLVKTLLDKGYNVRGTARSESSIAKLRDLFAPYGSKVSFTIVKDITKYESYRDAFENVTGIMHCASPFIMNPKDNVAELLDPAIKGAVSILNAAKAYGTNVRRVVFTSSFAAMMDASKGLRPDYVYNDDDWNPMTYEEAATTTNGAASYCASKALAERAMWDWMEENKDVVPFTLTSINPCWIFGPDVGIPDLDHLNESMSMVWRLVDATDVHPADFGGYIDVRDLAKIHVTALEDTSTAGKRFLAGHKFRWQLVADAARAAIPELQSRIPEGKPGFIEAIYGVDGTRAAKELHFTYTPLNIVIVDSLRQMLEAETKNKATVG